MSHVLDDAVTEEYVLEGTQNVLFLFLCVHRHADSGQRNYNIGSKGTVHDDRPYSLPYLERPQI